jgi:hypothetical protein
MTNEELMMEYKKDLEEEKNWKIEPVEDVVRLVEATVAAIDLENRLIVPLRVFIQVDN